MVRRSALLVAAFALVTTNAISGEPWKKVGNWSVEIDPPRGCFMLASFGGTAFRVGFDRRDNSGYVLLGNDAWKSLKVGQEYPIALQLDSDPPWSTTAGAVNMSGATALVIPFTNFKFLVDMPYKQTLAIYTNGKVVQTLPLSGSYNAVQEMITCQNYVDANRPRSGADPFSDRPSSGPANPFTPGQ